MDAEKKLRQALERICGLHDMKGDFWKAIADAKLMLAEMYPVERPVFEYQWRIVPGFSNYEISTAGEVRRATEGKRCYNIVLPKGMLIKGAVKRNGYIQYVLVDDNGKSCHMTGHRLVALTYIGEQPHTKWVVAHINHDRLDNRVENLMWASNSMNQLQSRYYIGYKKSVTPDQIKEIKDAYAESNNQSAVARMLNISRNVVSKVINGVCHVDYERMNHA